MGNTNIYIFTGKGGVGKSSIAAAHAVKSALDGQKTLLISTDMAHNLGDLFEIKLDKDIYNVSTNLDLYEIDPEYVMEKDFFYFQAYLQNFIMDDEYSLQDFGMIPGMEELFSLLKIAEIYNDGIYKRIIVDCAPTGETLSLLKFPELLSWYMEKLFPIGKISMRMLAPISKSLFKVEMPNKKAVSDIEKLYLRLIELQDLLKNREVTSVRIVTTPEKMVIEETKRNYMYMNMYGFNVDSLYINRILPCDIENTFFNDWIQIQKEYICYLKEIFSGIPIYEIPWYDEEILGEKNIRRIVTDVLLDKKVFNQKAIIKREKFIKIDNGYQLDISLPYQDKDNIDVFQSKTDIIIKVGNFKRSIPLPNILYNYVVVKAKYNKDVLSIIFEEGDSVKC